MVQLVFLLLGSQAIRREWRMLATIGTLWALLGLFIVIDPLEGTQYVTIHTLSVLLVIEGSAVLITGLLTGARSWLWGVRVCALTIPGLAIIETPWRNLMLISFLFGTALVIDGAIRLTATLIVKFPGWRLAVAGAMAEFVLAALAFTPWPVSYEATVPFCCGIALMMSGWTVLRSALLLRALPPDAAVTSLPMFEHQRGWHLPPLLPGPAPMAVPEDTEGARMIVHVWTPVGGAAGATVRRPVLDRYVAAADRAGTISTGHASIEMPPDIYISHYRLSEQDRTRQEFRQSLLASVSNNVPGRFLPSYGAEVAEWWEATEHVVFRRFDVDRLRAFWAAYRSDATYNLTNRNCSIVVAMALDAALEGVLGPDRMWPRLLSLVVHPDLHIATLLRKRARAMTWTPGLVLDYARSLQRVVEPPPLSWIDMVQQAMAGIRRIRRTHPKLPPSARKSAA